MSASAANEQNPLARWYKVFSEDLELKKADDSSIREALSKFCEKGEVKGAGPGFYRGGSYIGGMDMLENYGNSAYSKGKEQMIRAIAYDFFKALNNKQAADIAKSKPIEHVVSILSKAFNPKQAMFTKEFKKDKNMQKKAVAALRGAINSQYGANMIPESLNEHETVNKIAEVLYSLFQGLHTEFMTVAGDALRVLKNMQTLNAIVDASYKRQKDLVDSSGDAQLRTRAQESYDLYAKIKDELDRQIAIMSNLMDVAVGPTGKSLITLLEDNRDFSGLVRDIKDSIGTDRFSDKIAYMLSGVSTVARSADLIDKALKKLDMSLADFKAAKSANDLRLKVYKQITKKSPSSRELESMMAAAEIIYKNDYSHDDIVSYLEKVKQGGGGCGCDSGGKDDMDGGASPESPRSPASEAEPESPTPEVELPVSPDTKEGGEYKFGGNGKFGGDVFNDDYTDTGNTAYWSRKSLGNKVKKQEKMRKLLLADFRKMLRGHMQIIVDSANSIGPHIGKEIPVNEDLERFIDTVDQLETLDRENMHIALSGWARDAASKNERDKFMNSYMLCVKATEPLLSGPHGDMFKNFSSAVKGMIMTIDDFSEKIVKAVTEIHVDTPQEIRRTLAQTASLFFGAADGGGGDPILGDGRWSSIDKARSTLKYFYSICHIKSNLANVAEEMAAFGDGYEQVLGEEAGWLINKIKKQNNEMCEHVDPNYTPAGAPATPGSNPHIELADKIRTQITGMAIPGGMSPDDAKARARDNMTSFWTMQSKAKVRLVEIAQAIDMYLRSFADGIAKHPDSISSVVKMLDQVEIVAKWFNDRSGDNLATLFECFPSGIQTIDPVGLPGAHVADAPVEYKTILGPDGKIVKIATNDSPTISGNSHYYQWIEQDLKQDAAGGAEFNQGRAPGNPFIPLDMMNISTANGNPSAETLRTLKSQTEKVVKSMRALENILSAFATIGSKFGDLDMQSKTFMSPGQIFSGLCDYVVASTFTNGFEIMHDINNKSIYQTQYDTTAHDRNDEDEKKFKRSINAVKAKYRQAMVDAAAAAGANMGAQATDPTTSTPVNTVNQAAIEAMRIGDTAGALNPLCQIAVAGVTSQFGTPFQYNHIIHITNNINAIFGDALINGVAAAAAIDPALDANTNAAKTAVITASAAIFALGNAAAAAELAAKIATETLCASDPMMDPDKIAAIAYICAAGAHEAKSAAAAINAATVNAAATVAVTAVMAPFLTNINADQTAIHTAATRCIAAGWDGRNPGKSVQDALNVLLSDSDFNKSILDAVKVGAASSIYTGSTANTDINQRSISSGLGISHLYANNTNYSSPPEETTHAGVLIGPGTDRRKYSGIVMAATPCYNATQSGFLDYHSISEENKNRVDSAGYMDRFYETDLLFIMTIKSIVAKVFTAVDAYRLFNRPTQDSYQRDSFSPLRTILGGNGNKNNDTIGGLDHVEVKSEALELYLRLPLLAEWYRERFVARLTTTRTAGRLPTPAAPNDWVLSIIPSVDGTWSNFIRIMFDKYDYVSNGGYSENQLQEIIKEINNLYNAFKSKYPTSTVRNILVSFSLEINRIMGFIKQQEIDTYLRSKRNNLTTQTYNDEPDFVDFDILNSDGQYGRKTAPSDKFITVADRANRRQNRNLVHITKEVLDLREHIDIEFRNFTNNKDDKSIVPISKVIRNARQDLDSTKDAKDKYKIVLKLIQGTNRLDRLSQDKLVMVHEIVAAPLAALYNVWKVMAKWNALMHGTSIENLNAWGAARAAGTAGVGAINRAFVVYNTYLAFIATQYANATAAVREGFAEALTGDPNIIAESDANGGYYGYVVGIGGVGANVRVNLSDITEFDSNQLLRDLLTAIMDLSCHNNSLVQATLGTNAMINMDYSKLEEVCKSLLSDVKSNINKLKLSLTSSTNIFDKYENEKYTGSLRWLENHLVEELFNDRDQAGLQKGSSLLQQTFRELIIDPNVAAATNFGRHSRDNVLREIVYYRYLPDVAGANANNKTVHNASVNIDLTDINSGFPRNILSMIPTNQPGSKLSTKPSGPNFSNTIQFLQNNWSIGNDNVSSLLFTLNTTIHNYIRDCFENINSKFYLPLIESFINSAASNEMRTGGFWNLNYKNTPLVNGTPAMQFEAKGVAVANVGRVNTSAIVTLDKEHINGYIRGGAVRGWGNVWAANATLVNNIIFPCNALSPNENSLLFESTCDIIKVLITTMNQATKKKQFLYENITEIPESLREQLKASLPYYSKIFEQIYRRASFLKSLINTSVLGSTRLASAAGVAEEQIYFVYRTNVAANTQYWRAYDNFSTRNPLKATAANNSQDRSNYYNTLLNHLIDLSNSIKKCADNVYRELSDSSPFFMEFNKESLQDYKNQYGTLPFTPASNVLIPQLAMNGLRNTWNSASNATVLLPTDKIGSAVWKFNYASRLVLCRNDIEPSLDHMPGAKEIYNKYATSIKDNPLSTQDYSSTIKLLVVLSRYLNDGAVYTRLFSNSVMNLTAKYDEYKLIVGGNNILDTKVRLNSIFKYIADEVMTTLDTDLVAATDDTINNRLVTRLNNCRVELGVAAIMVGGPFAAKFNRTGRTANEREALSRLLPCPYQFLNTARGGVEDLISFAEADKSDDIKRQFTAHVDTQQSNSAYGRDDLRRWNIIDMNIVPINVHAFMKEVPFINILNYSYTFDSMIHEFIVPRYLRSATAPLVPGPPPPGTSFMIKQWHDAKDAEELMVQLLSYPYVTKNTDMKRLIPILNSLAFGNNSNKLGRPKYIGDQILGKALMLSQAGNDPANLPPNPLPLGPAAYAVNTRPLTAGLKYLEKAPVGANNPRASRAVTWTNVTTGANPLSVPNVAYCQELGTLRFHTKLVRNLLWFVQLQRVMRAVLSSHLSWVDTPVVRGLMIAKPQITEFENNEQYRRSEFDGTEYDALD